MNLPGKRVKRTRLVRTNRFVVALEVQAVIPDADPSEACYEPAVVELLRQVEAHAKAGDVDWLRQHGKVYTAFEAAYCGAMDVVTSDDRPRRNSERGNPRGRRGIRTRAR